MHHSKLITILKSLNPTEFRQFYRYLQAPLLTQSKDVLSLYDVVRKHSPVFDSPKLDRQKVFKKLYPKKAFDGNRFSILLFKLTKILDEYLIFLKFQQDEFQKKKLLTQIYGERNLNVIFKKNTEELLTELEQQPYRDSQYFYDSYFLQQDYYLQVNTAKRKEDILHLKKALDNLQTFYAVERLRLGLDLKNRERIFNECDPFDTYPASFASNNLTHQIYQQLICLMDTDEANYFNQTQSLLLTNIKQLNPKDSAVFIQTLVNYAIQKVAIDEEKYVQAAFELYDLGIETKCLLPNNNIPRGIFLNLVTFAAKLGKFDYANDFIKHYKIFLTPTIQVEIGKFAESFICFHQKKYGQANTILQSIRFNDPLLKLTAKALLIRCHYHLFETNPTYFNLVIASCVAMETSLRRNTRISKTKKEAYINFIFFLKKVTICKMNNANSKKEKMGLLVTFRNKKAIAAKGWIEEIIQQL